MTADTLWQDSTVAAVIYRGWLASFTHMDSVSGHETIPPQFIRARDSMPDSAYYHVRMMRISPEPQPWVAPEWFPTAALVLLCLIVFGSLLLSLRRTFTEVSDDCEPVE